MDPTTTIAWVSAGSGLVGALIGAGSALGGKWMDARHARKADERRQADDLLARFWEATDRYWRASASLRDTVEETQAAREARHPLGELDERRDRAIAEMNSAEIDARFLLARMRLNGWPIVIPARSLLAASRFAVSVDPASVHRMREAALREFEDQAREMTGAKDIYRVVRRRSRAHRRWGNLRLRIALWVLNRVGPRPE